jgi:hypothetical protein
MSNDEEVSPKNLMDLLDENSEEMESEDRNDRNDRATDQGDLKDLGDLGEREYGVRPAVNGPGIKKRDGLKRGLRTVVFLYPGFVHKFQEVPERAGNDMFDLFEGFVKQDERDRDITRERFFYVSVVLVVKPGHGRRPKHCERTVCVETWTENVPGVEPDPGCITPQEAVAMVRHFADRATWMGEGTRVHGDFHRDNFHFQRRPDGVPHLIPFDFGFAMVDGGHGDLKCFEPETRSFVSFLIFLLGRSESLHMAFLFIRLESCPKGL